MAKEDYNQNVKPEDFEDVAYNLLSENKTKSYRVLMSVYDNFVKAGDLYLKKEEKQKAILAYDEAVKYVPSKGLKDNLNRKIDKIQNPYQKKEEPKKNSSKNKIPLRQKKHSGLEKKTSIGEQADFLFKKIEDLWKYGKLGFLSILAFTFALFLIGSTLTGNVINAGQMNDFRIIGACFFACGLVFTFLYFKNKK